MRAAAILGLGCSPKSLAPFQTDKAIEWQLGMPADNDQAEIIVIFGGDGTIHRHLGQLVKLALPVLVVPTGSGNDFARALDLRSVRDSLTAWKHFREGKRNVRQIDLGVISAFGNAADPSAVAQGRPAPQEFQYFCCVAGVGVDCEVARKANRLPRWLRGSGGYVLSLAPTIFTFTPFLMKIFTPAPVSSTENWNIRSNRLTLLAAFANTSTFGDGMRIAPEAKMDDGLLDVCVVGGVNPFKFFCMFPTVYSGKHLSIREVEYFHSPRVRVETEHPLDVYADGEYVCRTPVEIRIQPAALKVITGNC